MAAAGVISDRVRKQLVAELSSLSAPVELELVVRDATVDQELRVNQALTRALAEAAPDGIHLSVRDLDEPGTAGDAEDVLALRIAQPAVVRRPSQPWRLPDRSIP